MGTPIYDMLKAYKEQEPLPFHMPGHLLGKGLKGELKLSGNLDITEIPGSDCLHSPTGVIKEAQELASRCYGADYTLFLVNGSTSGIHTMIQSVVKPGGKLIIGRDSHGSVLNALVLSHAQPVFVIPEVDDKNTIPLGVKARAIEKAIIENPDVQGVLLTRPNYYGIATPIKEISEMVHKHKIPLLIDEAHGAHFNFHKAFPETALKQGADLCVQSLHKTLPALTQTALLHGRNSEFVERSMVEKFSSMLQTTSPSYLLMASIDMVRDMMETEGDELYQKLLANIGEFNYKLENKTLITRVARDYKGFESDFTRIVLSFKNIGISGFEAEAQLRKRFGIVAEMADMDHIVLIATPFHTSGDFNRLIKALETLSNEFRGKIERRAKHIAFPTILPKTILPIYEAIKYKSYEVDINDSVNKISAASIVPYPPGIPVLNPGEEITHDIIEYLNSVIAMGCSVHGIDNGKISIVAV